MAIASHHVRFLSFSNCVITLRRMLAVGLTLLLCACATQAPKVDVPHQLFNDAGFVGNEPAPDPQAIFKVTEEMRQFIAKEIVTQIRSTSHQRALFNALYTKAQLKLEYDSSFTRNAAETFSARSGNCLSLVIMTAAIAKEMGLDISYQNVYTPELWSRSGALYFNVGHVNIVLGKRHFDDRNHLDKNYQMTIDFYPPEDTAGQRTTELAETTIIAMYFNNRAAESIADGKLDQAYRWAKAAITADPSFSAPYNTLAVIYLRHNDSGLAYETLKRALELDPGNKVAMSNIVQAMEETDRLNEAAQMRERLAALQPYPPFHFFKLGMKAMDERDYQTARKWFQKELDRAPDYHEFHFWIGIAYLRLGEVKRAEQHLAMAKSNSTSQKDHAIYSAKLDRIQATRTQFN